MRARFTLSLAMLSLFACAAPTAAPAPAHATIASPIDAASAPPPALTDASSDAAPPVATVRDAPDAAPPPAPMKLAGACVDVVADVVRRTRLHTPPVIDPARVDLDGDGTDDWIVTTDADAVAYHGYVYITRNNCAHFVGSWDSSAPVPLERSTRGLRDLEEGTPCKPSCCPTEVVRTLKFDGKVYRKVSQRTVTRDCSSLGSPSPP